MNELLTVVVTVHNTEAYVGQCVESIIKQTYTPLEIILVDDGSTDDSDKICDTLATLDSRIQVIHQEQQGAAAARKAGIQAATGEYIHFVDDDDWLKPNMEAVMMNGLTKNDADVIVCGYLDYVGDHVYRRAPGQIKPGVYDRKAMIRDVFPYMMLPYPRTYSGAGLQIPLWMKVFRTSIAYDAVMRVDPSIKKHNDLACVYEAIYNANRMVIISDNLYHHRRGRKNSITKRFLPDLYSVIEALMNHMLSGPLAEDLLIAKQLPKLFTINIAYSESTNGRGQRSIEEMQVRMRIRQRIKDLARQFTQASRNAQSTAQSVGTRRPKPKARPYHPAQPSAKVQSGVQTQPQYASRKRVTRHVQRPARSIPHKLQRNERAAVPSHPRQHPAVQRSKRKPPISIRVVKSGKRGRDS
ncbi:MAG: glycosyltransferase family 2 protein [Oscillospiraceae bacterium]|jgi:glycosyltransferase involved in cell wall biosynthesis|nr:glycosyltransferase family 2 protein [Oscillospiraceae bacterium]